MSEFLTVPQVARAFGVRSRTVRGWIHRKILSAKKDRVTGTLYVPREEVERRKSDLEDWQPGLKPVTFTGGEPDGEPATSDSEQEVEDLAKAKEGQAQDQGNTGAEREQQPRREREAPAKAKKSSWGTVLDDEDEEEE